MKDFKDWFNLNSGVQMQTGWLLAVESVRAYGLPRFYFCMTLNETPTYKHRVPPFY